MTPLAPTCGDVYGSLSQSGHPCARAVQHDRDDAHGHVCRCEAEHYLETHPHRPKAAAR